MSHFPLRNPPPQRFSRGRPTDWTAVFALAGLAVALLLVALLRPGR